MRIMIVGAGGVGGYVAGRLAQKQEHAITVVARGAQLAAIQAQGLTIVDGEERFTVHPAATDKPAGIQDAILLCTKGYGLEQAVEQIRPCVGAHTVVVPLLNGVNLHERIAAQLGAVGYAASGSIYIYAQIISPGVVEKNGPLLRVVLGMPGKRAADAPDALHQLAQAIQASGIPAEVSDDIIRENWMKWAVLVSNGQANAYFNAPLGEIRDDPARMQFVLALLHEVLATAAAEGVDMPPDMEQRVLTTMKNLPHGSVSSVARDIATPGKPTELSLFAGEVCRLAGKHGIPAPANRSILERFKDRV